MQLLIPFHVCCMGTRLSCFFSTEMSDGVNSFLCIYSFPISLSPLLDLPPDPFPWWTVGAFYLVSLSLISALLFLPISPRYTATTLPCSNISNDSYWLIHSYVPAWHSRPQLFSTKCSPAFFPTWCLYRPVLTQLGPLPFPEYAPCFPVLQLSLLS